MSRLDLSRAPVPVDTGVVHTLHSQLHMFKKCFSGKDFVEQLLKLGREAESARQGSSEPNTPSPQITGFQGSPGASRHAFNSPASSTRINYTVQYAKDIGQFLLSEEILLSLPGLRESAGYGSEDEEEGEGERGLTGLQHESSSIQSDHRVSMQDRAEGGRGRDRDNAAVKTTAKNAGSSSSSSAENSPQLQPPRRRQTRGRPQFNHLTEVEERDLSTAHLPRQFVYSPQSHYKFANVEDFESRALYHSQILSASTLPQAVVGMEETTAFETARMGMLFLVHDLLLQRARRERRVKQFLQTPPAVSVADRRKHQYVDCNLIFKL